MMRTKVVKVAIFVVVTGLTLLLVGNQIAKIKLTGRYGLVAYFDDATGLFVNDDVRLAGITVGKVTGIEVADGKAEVSFELENDVKLPVDSKAAVRWRNLLGQRFIYVFPGESKNLLAAGDTVRRSVDVVDFGRLVNSLGPLARAVDPKQLNEILIALVQAVEGNEGGLHRLIVNLNATLGTLADRDATINRLIGDYETVTGTLARRDEQIQTMVDNLLLLTKAFADHSDLLDGALSELAVMNHGLDVLLTRNADELARIIRNLATVTHAASTKIDELESAFAAIPESTRQLFTTVDAGSFVKVNFICISPDAPTSPDAPECPHEPLIPNESGPPQMGARAFVLERGAGRLDSLDAFDRLLVGFAR